MKCIMLLSHMMLICGRWDEPSQWG